MKNHFLIVGLLIILPGHRLASATESKTQPNIVLLFVDDLGWFDVGYRNPKFESTGNCLKGAV